LRWYKHKWLNWTENTINLHPTAPWTWKRAIRFPGEQPEFATDFNLDYTSGMSVPIVEMLGNFTYDVNALLKMKAHAAKTIIKKAQVQ
jgi:hypothetical protein